jgi:endothelin-converting enzyme/putative endopeptidase
MRLILLLPLLALIVRMNVVAQAGPASSGPGFSTANMDMTADPCVDFYQYACGTWMANNPIPVDQSGWGVFNLLTDRNRTILRGILEKASVNNSKRSAVEQKIGDFYASCMDETTIEKLGIQPLETELKRIEAIQSKRAILPALVQLHRVGVGVFFEFSPEPDPKNSMQMIANIDQGGLGLPDRDNYLKDDPRSAKLREEYLAHVQNMLQLLGESSTEAAADARAVLRTETDLAKGSLDRVSRRDPNQTFHKMSVKELVALSPSIDWPKYFAGMGAPHFADLDVSVPDFFKSVDAVLRNSSLADLKSYLRWHLVHSEAPFLARAFVDENFHFFGQTLTGAGELQPRWKRCVQAVDNNLGFALGQEYVEQAFPPDAKARVMTMVQQIEKMLNQDIQSLDWMTPATKTQALIKLRSVTEKIGYPEKWPDYSGVKILRGAAVENDRRATEFEVHRQLTKIGLHADRNEWSRTPSSVTAYNSLEKNTINFPAGILQPPFFDNRMDAAVNYGAIGSTIGHELTHGFDDEGRHFDAEGNLSNWWTAEDAAEFEKRADCFIKEYSAFSLMEGVHLNGKLTLGENTADNGGVRLAFMALMESMAGRPQPNLDGFTPQQRFFLAYGQVYCQNVRPERLRMFAQTDPHSGRYRVNGVLGNMPEFREAFACHEGQPMVHAPACRVW